MARIGHTGIITWLAEGLQTSRQTIYDIGARCLAPAESPSAPVEPADNVAGQADEIVTFHDWLNLLVH